MNGIDYILRQHTPDASRAMPRSQKVNYRLRHSRAAAAIIERNGEMPRAKLARLRGVSRSYMHEICAEGVKHGVLAEKHVRLPEAGKFTSIVRLP